MPSHCTQIGRALRRLGRGRGWASVVLLATLETSRPRIKEAPFIIRFPPIQGGFRVYIHRQKVNTSLKAEKPRKELGQKHSKLSRTKYEREITRTTCTRASNFISPMYTSLSIFVLTSPAAHVPVQEAQKLLGSAERSRTRTGPDV